MVLLLLLTGLLIYKIVSKNDSNDRLIQVMNGLLLFNFVAGCFFNSTGEAFGGMFRNSSLLVLEKNILNFALWIIGLQARIWLRRHRHLPEFYMLLLSSMMGVFFMLSANHLLLFYLALELSTIPLAALCNFDLSKRTSGEAAMKMILSSAFSSGILLFGISIVYGTTGTLDFAGISAAFYNSPLQIMAFLFLFTGFAFKLSVVPFHFWTADVYEGSPVAVTAYLSVISKGAMVFVLTSVLYGVFGHLQEVWYTVLTIAAVLTMTIGNLFALRQDNIKRFLAFSSIAQVAFILIGISAGTATGMSTAVYFVLIYMFSNLGAFGVVAAISSNTGRELISEYKGFGRSNPALSWVMAISLFSLAGIPPTAGFFGKIFLLTAGASVGNYALIAFAALNMIVSLYYYLHIIRIMFMETSDTGLSRITSGLSIHIALMICIAGVILTGFTPGLFEYIISLSFGLH